MYRWGILLKNRYYYQAKPSGNAKLSIKVGIVKEAVYL